MILSKNNIEVHVFRVIFFNVDALLENCDTVQDFYPNKQE